MKGFLGRILGRSAPDIAESRRSEADLPALVLREGTTFPIVDWIAIEEFAPKNAEQNVVDEFWTTAAFAWLERLKHTLGSGYKITESDRFILLSALEPRPAKVLHEYAEKTRRRILTLLEGIACDSGKGKVCILVFEDKDAYYQYVSNYYPEEGEFAQSGGMFLQFGYGHFVFAESDMFQMEPTIAHELTHCLMQHLPIPAWLNEGIAVNTEQRLCPPLGGPLETPRELQRMHLAFWGASTIQEFWSGKSWNRPGDSNKLSYDLAAHLVRLAAADRKAFLGFANAASLSDSGEAAALAHLGCSVARLAQAVLGDGLWEPKPQTWSSGIEHGQF